MKILYLQMWKYTYRYSTEEEITKNYHKSTCKRLIADKSYLLKLGWIYTTLIRLVLRGKVTSNPSKK